LKFHLRTLFALTAVCACLSLWLGTRRIALFPGSLAQIVLTLPANGGVAIDGKSISDDFYETLMNDVALSGDNSISSCTEAELRSAIQIDVKAKDGHTSLVTISAMGNPIVTDRSRVRAMYKIALRTLASGGIPADTQIKILNVPAL